MSKLYRFKLLTLVGREFSMLFASASLVLCSASAFATPHYDSPMPVVSDEDKTKPVDPFTQENISVTPAPPINGKMGDFIGRFSKANYFYPYHQEIELHAGLVFGVKDASDDEDLMNGILGFSYLLPRRTSPKWELGADLSMVGHGHVRVSRRTIFNEKGSFRPYYELGVMNKMVPDEKFASLSNWDNYLFRMGIGLSDILRPPKSVQLELEVAIGAEDLLIFFTYGYAWGF